MVNHPADYTWSSYHFNALLTPIKLITPHPLYLRLGETPTIRAKHYSSLFESEIPDFKLEEIRGAINSTRVLGGEVFKRQLEKQTGLSLIPNQWGGARR